MGVLVEAVRPHLAVGKPSAARQGFLKPAVPVAGTSLPQKMLGGDATVPVKCIQDKPRVRQSPYGVGPRFSSTGSYPERSATMRLHKGQSTQAEHSG